MEEEKRVLKLDSYTGEEVRPWVRDWEGGVKVENEEEGSVSS